MSEHTAEPWKLTRKNPALSVGLRGETPHLDIGRIFTGSIEGVANARRIVACVNACAGLPTEELEGLAGEHVVAVLRSGRRLSDETARMEKAEARAEELERLLAALLKASDLVDGAWDQDEAVQIYSSAKKEARASLAGKP